jgi:hypothetical protein
MTWLVQWEGADGVEIVGSWASDRYGVRERVWALRAYRAGSLPCRLTLRLARTPERGRAVLREQMGAAT